MVFLLSALSATAEAASSRCARASIDPTAAAAGANGVAPASPGMTDDMTRTFSDLPAYLGDGSPEGVVAIPDPWERYNRHVFAFNRQVDDRVLRPVARAYLASIPDPVRGGIRHALRNLHEPVNSLNLLLQRAPHASACSLERFAVNLTSGWGGVRDSATRSGLAESDTDFGQTLAHWGWRRSRYLILPFMGPGTVRDRSGTVFDGVVSPLSYIQPVGVRLAVVGTSIVGARAQMLPFDNAENGVSDDYAFVRDVWSQHRAFQIQSLRADQR